SGAAQVKAVPPHVPPVQTSFLVQAFPSSHAVPSAAARFEHMPLVGSHVPATWHWSSAVQATVVVALQLELVWQVCTLVEALPLLHAVLLLAFGLERGPVVLLLVPARWQWSYEV